MHRIPCLAYSSVFSVLTAPHCSAFPPQDGFNGWAWLIVLMMSTLGLSIAAVMKYLDSVVKIMCTAASMVHHPPLLLLLLTVGSIGTRPWWPHVFRCVAPARGRPAAYGTFFLECR